MEAAKGLFAEDVISDYSVSETTLEQVRLETIISPHLQTQFMHTSQLTLVDQTITKSSLPKDILKEKCKFKYTFI